MTATKTCKTCGKVLRDANISGYCRQHITSALLTVPRKPLPKCACMQCGASIGPRVVSGLCRRCYDIKHYGESKRIAARIVPAGAARRVSDLLRIAAAYTGIPVPAIAGPGRSADVVRARHAITLVAWESGRPLAAIAAALKRKDHSTLVSGRDRAQVLMACDEAFRAMVEHLRAAPVPAVVPVLKVVEQAPVAEQPEEWELPDDEIVSRRVRAYREARAA